MYSIEKARLEDIETLIAIQISAFSSDRAICGSGPPGYDDYDHQAKVLMETSYYVIRREKRIVGGFYFIQTPDRIILHRLFIDPRYQSRGIGTFTLDFLKHAAPYGTIIELETPTFSTNAHRFYESNGFQRITSIDYGSSRSYLYRQVITSEAK